MLKKIKITMTALLFVCILALVQPQQTFADEGLSIRVVLNAETVKFDVNPFIKDGSTLVQLRPIFEKFGLKLTWDAETKTITGEKDGKIIKLQIDSLTAEINGNQVQLEAAPTIVSGNTFVPLRFIGESLDGKVEWNQNTKTANIKTKQIFTTSDGKAQITTYGKWTPKTDAPASVKLYIKSADLNMFMINSSEKKDTDVHSSEEFFKGFKEAFPADEFQESDVTFQGRPAKQLASFFEKDGIRGVFNIVFFESDDSYYAFSYGYLKANEKTAQEEFQEIFNSFKLLNAN